MAILCRIALQSLATINLVMASQSSYYRSNQIHLGLQNYQKIALPQLHTLQAVHIQLAVRKNSQLLTTSRGLLLMLEIFFLFYGTKIDLTLRLLTHHFLVEYW